MIRHFVDRQPGKKFDKVALIEAAYSEFRTLLAEHYQPEVAPIPGADATFHWLRNHGIQIAATSGFYREVARLILDSAGWCDTFAAMFPAAMSLGGGPHPS